jgi:hypothetical protein
VSLCYGCGMAVGAEDEYHPHAACLMFRACEDAAQVNDNLAAVVEHGSAQERERLIGIAEEMIGVGTPDALKFGNLYSKEKHTTEGWIAAFREFIRRAKEGA